MKSLGLLAMAAIASGLPLHGFRFQQSRDLPEPVQDWEGTTDYEENAQHSFAGVPGFQHAYKLTPGKPCEAFQDCKSCTANTWSSDNNGVSAPQGGNVCVWTRVGVRFQSDPAPVATPNQYNHWAGVPSFDHNEKGNGPPGSVTDAHGDVVAGEVDPDQRIYSWRCVEERDPKSEQGKRGWMCNKPLTHEVVDEKTDELDDFGTENMNGDPNHMDIASLDRAEPIFTVANELGEGEGDDSVKAGEDMVGGMSRNEYEGYPTIGAKTSIIKYPNNGP